MVVDDKDRHGGNDDISEIERLLVEDETLYVTDITNADMSSYYSRFMTRYGRRLRRRQKGRDESEGYYI